MLDQWIQIIDLFAQVSSDRSTLDELRQTIQDRGKWPKVRGLFDRIRQKSLKADRVKDEALRTQYGFEEACAKTLYNLTYPQAPYDADSPYWIVPSALDTARCLGINEASVITIVKSKREVWTSRNPEKA